MSVHRKQDLVGLVFAVVSWFVTLSAWHLQFYVSLRTGNTLLIQYSARSKPFVEESAELFEGLLRAGYPGLCKKTLFV